jgi:CheY-like chemotaxis protein/HPt (histidine-containing phosphotransfer) domain-containing protein
MTGEETIKEIRRREAHLAEDGGSSSSSNNTTTALTIVGCSGNARKTEHLAAGADLFWQKPPPKPAAMSRIIRELLLPKLPATWRILVVDDSALIRMSMGRMLEHELPGAMVSLASSPAEALAAMQDSPFDLIVLDENLGDTDVKGTDIARQIRSGVLGDSAAAISNSRAVIAGFSGNSMVSEHLAAGCDVSWSKPVRPNEIKTSLRDCLFATSVVVSSSTPAVVTAASSNPVSPSFSPLVPLDRPAWLEAFRSMFGDDDEAYQTELACVLAEFSADVDALASHVEAGSFMNIKSVAHKMKGAAQMLGLESVAAEARALEKMASERVSVTTASGGGGGDAAAVAEVAARASSAAFVNTIRDLVNTTKQGL